jgi:hypothetical protein
MLGSVPLPPKKAGTPGEESLPISATEPTFAPAESVPFNLTVSQLPEPLPPVKLDGEGRILGWLHRVALALATQFGKGRPSEPTTS